MEVSEEKLLELAACFKKMRVFRNEEGKLYIKENGNDVSKDVEHPIGIEIYEVVDMATEITDEEILEVYKELREAGIKWTDIKRENLGRLRKDNYPHEIGYNVPVPPEMLGIQESGVERKILKAGEIVIIDLDCLELALNEKGSNFTKTADVIACVWEY